MKRKEVIRQLKGLTIYCKEEYKATGNTDYKVDVIALKFAIRAIEEEDIPFWKVFLMGSIFWLGFCYMAVNIFY